MLKSTAGDYLVRPLSEATQESKKRAQRKVEDKERGVRSSTLSLSSTMSRQSNASVANRMVMNSLGRRTSARPASSRAQRAPAAAAAAADQSAQQG